MLWSAAFGGKGYFVSITIDIRPLPTHLHVTVAGEYTLGGTKDALLRIRQSVDDYMSTKVLIDSRGVVGDPSLRERFELVTFILQMRIRAILHGKPSNAATAIVGTPPLMHPARYGIRLLLERNVKITICGTVEEALAWLGVEVQPSEMVPDA